MEAGGSWHAASFGPLQGGISYHLVAAYNGDVLRVYRNGTLATSNANRSSSPTPETATLKFSKHAIAPQYVVSFRRSCKICETLALCGGEVLERR